MNKKYVIYKTATMQIVKLADEEPDYSKMRENDEDFDDVENWMMIDSRKKQIEKFINLKS